MSHNGACVLTHVAIGSLCVCRENNQHNVCAVYVRQTSCAKKCVPVWEHKEKIEQISVLSQNNQCTVYDIFCVRTSWYIICAPYVCMTVVKNIEQSVCVQNVCVCVCVKCLCVS